MRKMEYDVDKSPKWIKKDNVIKFCDDDFIRIVNFFVFHAPVENLSAKSKTIEEYGWNTPWKKPYYLNKQLKQSSSNMNLLYSASGYDRLPEALDKAGLLNDFPSDLSKERASFYNTKKNQFVSVFFHIWNAFAHGRFEIVDVNGESTFIFEDVAPKRGKNGKTNLSARMILRKTTLLKWINIIENGEKEYE